MQSIIKQKSKVYTKNNLKSYLASPGGFYGWLNIFLLTICLGIVVFSAQQAQWLDPAPSLLTILFFSILVGVFTAKSRWPLIFSLSLAAVLGILVIIWQCVIVTPSIDYPSSLLQFIANLQLFWDAQNLGLPIPVTTHIALIFGLLCWLIGYISSWLFVRKHNPWPGIVLGTIMLLVILNFWQGKHYVYFLVFSTASLIFIIIANYTGNLLRIQDLQKGKIINKYKFWPMMGVGISAVILSLTWLSPGFGIKPVAEFASVNNPYRYSVDHAWQNFFAKIPGNSGPTLVHGGQADLVFGGSLTVSDQVYFIIESARQDYWKTQIYDYYDSTGWKTSPTMETTVDPSPSVDENLTSNSLNYTVIPQISTDVLPSYGDFIFSSSPVLIKKLAPISFQINLFNSSSDSLLPADIASLAKSIRNTRIYRRRMTDTQLYALIPADLKVLNIEHSGSRIQSFTVTREPQIDTIIALSSATIQTPQQRFDLTVKTEDTIQAQDLAQAGEIYPDQITDVYLQLPKTLPPRVNELAESVVQGSSNPYEKALALKKYLSQYPYTLNIEAPPPDSDGVDYFLFTEKAGYCTYFASAMTVMLRSVGVPARLATGFLTGKYLPDSQRNILRDRDYHAWAEVYFPQYGWITLDPTSGGVSSGINPSIDIFPVPPVDDLTEENVPSETSVTPEISDQQEIPFSSVPTSTPSKNNVNLIVIPGVVILTGLLILYGLFKRKTRYGSNLYSGLLFLSSLGGFGPKPWQTPLEFSEQLSSVLPSQASTINSIISNYTIRSYSGIKISQFEEIDKKSWSELKKVLLKKILHID